MSSIDFITSYEIISKISEFSKKNSVQTYLVGGFVRDKLLNNNSNDVDISVIGNAIEFAEKFCRENKLKLSFIYKKFGTALLETSGLKIEFAMARKESYKYDSRKPDVKPGTLYDDLSRRDFTINALAISLNDESNKIIDYFNGLDDLKKGILRTPLEPEKTFSDDPLRMMRACRFAAQLNFKIEPYTFEAIRKMRERLIIENDSPGVVSQERITDEFMKILASPYPSHGLILMFTSGLMEIVFPEIHELEGVEQRKDHHHKDVFYHTMQVIDNIVPKTNNVWLRFAALVHDIAKPATKKFIDGTGWTFHGHEEMGARWMKKIFSRMRLPNEKLNYVEKLVRLHLRPIALAEENVTDSAIRRLIFEAGDAIEDLLILCRADITSKDPRKIEKYLANFDRVEKRISEVEERDRIRNFQSPVRGNEIMKICKIQPGRKVGILKKKIEEAILEGKIPNEHDAALKYLYEIKDSVLSEN